MGQELRQSTAVNVTVGPVLDASGVAVTGAVISDFKLAKAGGDPAALNGSATATHRHTGTYSIGLTASDVDTVATLEITLDKGTDAMQTVRFQVIEESVYDALYASGAEAMTEEDVEAAADAALTAYPVATLTQTQSAVSDGLTAAIGAAGASLTAIPWNAAWSSETIGADVVEWMGVTVTEALLDDTGLRTALGMASGNLDSQLTTIGGNVVTILSHTGSDGVKILDGAITASKFADDAITAAKIATGAFTADAFAANALVAATFATNCITASKVAADAVTEIQAGLGTASNQITILTQLGTITTNISNRTVSTAAATQMTRMFTDTITVDDATFTPTATSFETDQTADDEPRYANHVLTGQTGDNEKISVRITGYAYTNGKVKLTVDALNSAPLDGDTFLKMGRIEQ